MCFLVPAGKDFLSFWLAEMSMKLSCAAVCGALSLKRTVSFWTKIPKKAQRECVDLVESFLTSYQSAEERLCASRTSLGGEFLTVMPVTGGRGGWPICRYSCDPKGCFPAEFLAHRTSMESLRGAEHNGVLCVVWGGRELAGEFFVLAIDHGAHESASLEVICHRSIFAVSPQKRVKPSSLKSLGRAECRRCGCCLPGGRKASVFGEVQSERRCC